MGLKNLTVEVTDIGLCVISLDHDGVYFLLLLSALLAAKNAGKGKILYQFQVGIMKEVIPVRISREAMIAPLSGKLITNNIIMMWLVLLYAICMDNIGVVAKFQNLPVQY